MSADFRTEDHAKRVITVSDLDESADNQSLLNRYFGAYGRIVGIQIWHAKKSSLAHAFVTFSSSAEADVAINDGRQAQLAEGWHLSRAAPTSMRAHYRPPREMPVPRSAPTSLHARYGPPQEMPVPGGLKDAPSKGVPAVPSPASIARFSASANPPNTLKTSPPQAYFYANQSPSILGAIAPPVATPVTQATYIPPTLSRTTSGLSNKPSLAPGSTPATATVPPQKPQQLSTSRVAPTYAGMSFRAQPKDPTQSSVAASSTSAPPANNPGSVTPTITGTTRAFPSQIASRAPLPDSAAKPTPQVMPKDPSSLSAALSFASGLPKPGTIPMAVPPKPPLPSSLLPPGKTNPSVDSTPSVQRADEDVKRPGPSLGAAVLERPTLRESIEASVRSGQLDTTMPASSSTSAIYWGPSALGAPNASKTAEAPLALSSSASASEAEGLLDPPPSRATEGTQAVNALKAELDEHRSRIAELEAQLRVADGAKEKEAQQQARIEQLEADLVEARTMIRTVSEETSTTRISASPSPTQADADGSNHALPRPLKRRRSETEDELDEQTDQTEDSQRNKRIRLECEPEQAAELAVFAVSTSRQLDEERAKNEALTLQLAEATEQRDVAQRQVEVLLKEAEFPMGPFMLEALSVWHGMEGGR